MLASAAGIAEVPIAKEALGVTVTVAEAREPVLATFVGSVVPTSIVCGMAIVKATLVAVMTTSVFVATLGAVKNPVLEIVPALADQFTAVFEVPLTLAANCSCSCDATVALLGVRVSAATELLVEPALCGAAPHATVRPIRLSKGKRTRKVGTNFLSREFLVDASSPASDIENNLGTELGGPSFESLSGTVEKGRRERQITLEQAPQGTLVHHERTLYFRV
jgi:hypothetical protein